VERRLDHVHCWEAVSGVATINVLNDSINRWLEMNPKCRIRAVLSFVIDGVTIAIRLWYDGQMAVPPQPQQ
jgi:hypothetical protein